MKIYQKKANLTLKKSKKYMGFWHSYLKEENIKFMKNLQTTCAILNPTGFIIINCFENSFWLVKNCSICHSIEQFFDDNQ